MSQSPYTPQKKIITGLVGDLEILVNSPKQADEKAIPYAAICHPHPLHGGTMNNKVVYMIASTFNALGVGTVCFNFRGVGKSAGKFDDGFGETEDLRVVVDWLKKEYSPSELWLAGFSFGGYIALNGDRDMNASRLLLVAPAVERLEFGLQLNEKPTLVIMGDKDEIISPSTVSEWAATQIHQPQLHWMAEAGHFFHGKLNELREVILTAWRV
ncbi:alpha/beta fold hydrolase [Candidatus Parabeggiatoa sp. HSG14]|uniref:alpha/beta hydrolase n=1 Tax=Candidatus Parabeggiatoa sp. HSG14 TaxID=3055593 RepID=UPI0025A7D06E|nr:alpha/beta fold hydrolase [Thiotrichales bacterium HSG14]